MIISIAICTRDRASLLRGALQSFFAMRFPANAPFELLVVDNASTDDTRRVVAAFEREHAGVVRYLVEPEPGLSRARNLALVHARGDILAYVDDDVLFDADWLCNVVQAFEEHPEAGCLGGLTRLAFDGARPQWLTPYLSSLYGVGVQDDSTRAMRFPEHPYGLNMAFRRQVLEQVGGFSPRLGRVGRLLLSGEETELFSRIADAGIVAIHTPGAVVHHRIPADRASVAWVLRRQFWGGVSRAIAEALTGALGPGQCARRAYHEARHLVAAIPAALLRLPRALAGRDGASVESLARLAQRCGAVRQFARMSIGGRRPLPHNEAPDAHRS